MALKATCRAACSQRLCSRCKNSLSPCRDTKLLRAVIREDMSMAMVDELIKDIARSVEYLDSHFTINVNDVHKPEGQSLAVSQSLALGAFCCQRRQ